MTWSVEYSEGLFLVKDYPFPETLPKSIRIEDIECVILNRYPTELWLKSGDIVFFPANKLQLLYEIHQSTPLRFENRDDPWALLLEPYLDTSFTDEEKERTLEQLHAIGIDSKEVSKLRSFAQPVQLANFFWWEWAHLGMFDLFSAMKKSIFFLYEVKPKNYQRALKIARMGKVLEVVAVKKLEELKQIPQSYLLWNKLGKARNVPQVKVDSVYGYSVVPSYSESHRKYHTVDHLEKVLEYLKFKADKATSWDCLLMAAFYHDIVYSPFSKTNEEDSVRRCFSQTEAWHWSEAEKRLITSYILMTKDHLAHNRKGDFALLSNADLMLLAQSPREYGLTRYLIYAEYKSIPWFIFRKKRMEFVEKFLSAAHENRVFVGEEIHQNKIAATNLAQELLDLQSSSRFFRKK